jgi:DNA-binding response OmpR family regulator
LSNNAPFNSTQQASTAAHSRRALIIGDANSLNLQQKLTANSYVTRRAMVTDAAWSISDFVPDVIIIVVTPHADSEAELETVALARKLRAETATYSLPLVFAWSEDEHSLRTAAQYIGVDDYFSLSIPTVEMLARLDSLFWRVESGRRSVPVISDRRLEIDNFMFMLDAVREDARASLSGTLALIYAVSVRGKAETLDKAVRDVTLAKAHGFLKLNLRRVDAVAYYGPTALLVYLPRMDARSATAALSRLHREFMQEHKDRNIVVGLTSFPAGGSDVEGLIERAEVAVNIARSASTAKHVIAYESTTKPAAPARAAAAAQKPPTRIKPKVSSQIEPQVPIVSPTPASSLGVEPIEEPARESVPEIIEETVPETTEESVSETIEESVPETVREDVPETVPVPEPVTALETVEVPEPANAPESVPVLEPVLDTEPVNAPEPVPVPEPVNVPESIPVTEHVPEPVPELVAAIPAKRSEARLNPTAAMSAQEIARAADMAAARELERRASGAVMPRRLLLTVSDATRMTQLNSLIRAAGYEARAAFDGQQALHLLRIEKPDLLLLDYELQGIDGVETIRRLKKQGGGRLSLPVIMILSSDSERARHEALELGAHSVHVTPYDPAELLESVRQAGSAE